MNHKNGSGPYSVNSDGIGSDFEIWRAETDLEGEKKFDRYMYIKTYLEAIEIELALREKRAAKKDQIALENFMRGANVQILKD